MLWLAAARLRQVSSVLVAEVQAEVTLMLGAKSGGKKALVSPPVVNYSPQSKILFATSHLFVRSGAEKTLLLCILNAPSQGFI